MTTIKIRFVQRDKDFLIQRKTWFGWKYIGYTIDMGYGSCYILYSGSTKEETLKLVLEQYYQKDKRFVEVIEYPKLKMY